MNVLCLQEDAFYELIEKVVERLKPQTEAGFKWVPPQEAMILLNVKKTKLQSLRNEGRIRYAQPDRKTILYDRDSINEYLEKNAQNTF